MPRTLYTIVTLANGAQSTYNEKFPSVAECEEERLRINDRQSVACRRATVRTTHTSRSHRLILIGNAAGGTTMLYMLVVCGGAICMPVDSAATYTLTWPESEARAIDARRFAQRGC